MGERDKLLAIVSDELPSTARRRAERRQRRAVQLRRRNALGVLAGLALLVGVIVGAGSGDDSGGEGGADQAQAEASPPPQLPGGGRTIVPGRRVVAFYGAPQDEELGVLGIGSPDQAGRKLLRQARAYRSTREKLLPAMELISTVVNRAPGNDGKYRTRLTDSVIRRYLRAARRINGILILDIQPGQADFVTESRVLEKWLKEPDVSLALDPEWRMQPGQIPGQVIGSVQASEINQVSNFLADIVRRNRLPQKLLVIHQFTGDMIDNRAQLRRVPGVQTILNVDGFGTRAQKVAKYRELAQRREPNGFKLFYKEDQGLMTPRQVEGLSPRPRFVIYE